MRTIIYTAILAGLTGAFALGWILAQTSAQGQPTDHTSGLKGWTKGKGWGPWGKEDEVGALNALSPASVKAALDLVREGKVYDLGVNYDAESFKWPGHNPGVIMTYRGPEGVKRQGDFEPVADRTLNPDGVAWHSCALFISDNVGTQIDGLAHITQGDQNAWYNGFREEEWGGNFGVRKCDSTTIPPIITRGVLLDVARFRKVDALPSHYRITAADLRATAEAQKIRLRPGDTVLIRIGTLRHWGVNGANHKTLGEHDSAGIDLAAAKWLVEEQGAMLIGSDTSGLEWSPGPGESAGGFIPVHRYLLIDQGVHIGEFHNLEELARQRVHEFCYICTTAKIRGAVAGFALRPIAIR
jgi:kynurenine formamidase